MNKTKHNDYITIAIVGVFAFAVLGIVGLYSVPSNSSGQSSVLIPVGTTGSVVNASVIYTKANTTGITNFLDSVNSPVGGAPKLVIQASSILFDSNQTQFPFSTYFNVPLQTQSLTDAQGHSLDLGTLQISFFVGTTSQQTIVLTGEMQAFLDNTMVSDQQIYAQGVATGSTLPITVGGQKAFTFTFADEGKTWTDKSTHVFKVVLTKIQATSGFGTNQNSFSTNSQFLAYILPMTVDKSKITVIGVNNKAVSIFQSDDTLSLCGRSGVVTQSVTYQNGIPNYNIYLSSGAVNTGLVTVTQNGFPITSGQSGATSPNFNGANPDSLEGKNLGTKSCVKLTGIPRNVQIDINAGGKDYLVQTPVTQFDYVYDCSGTVTTVNAETKITGGCTNNFSG